MAVSKTNKVKNKVIEEVVDVETPNAIEVEVPTNDAPNDKVSKIEVDAEATEKSVRKEGNVRIRMREDHRCCIAMVRYDLKAGQTYTVPENVKKILDSHGLLSPLN